MSSDNSDKTIPRRSFLLSLRNMALSLGALGVFPKTSWAFISAHASRNRKTVVQALTSGTTWVAPAGIVKILSVECWGGGGGAAGVNAGSSYGGGGGGAYAKKLNISVAPGASITYQIGAGGTSPGTATAGTDGGDTWFINSTTVRAKGGNGGSANGGGGARSSGAGNGAAGGAGAVPGGGAGSSGGNTNSANGPASSSGGAGQIIITYRV